MARSCDTGSEALVGKGAGTAKPFAEGVSGCAADMAGEVGMTGSTAISDAAGASLRWGAASVRAGKA